MASFEFLAIILTGLGLSVSIIYYANVLQNANKTRQTQLFMNLYQTVVTENFNQNLIEMLGAEWTDYQDYLNKYGPIDNPKMAAKRFSTWQVYNGIGFLLMENFIELEKVWQLFGGQGPNMMWRKWESIILGIREGIDSPSYMLGFEYLANSIEERRKQQGLSTDRTLTNLYQ